MPTNKQRREAARRHLERQLQRRQEGNIKRKRRNLIVTIASSIVTVVVIIVVMVAVVNDNKKHSASAGATPTDTSSPAASTSAAAPLPQTAGPCGYSQVTGGTKDVGFPPDPSPTPTTNRIVTFNTNKGIVTLTLDATMAPCTVQSIAYLVGKQLYDNTQCFRLVTTSIYVLQCGDPANDGSGGPGYQVKDENLAQVDYSQVGTVAMANAGAGTDGSQFFIIYKDSSAGLQKSYTEIGHITGGMDIIQQVAAGGEDDSNGSGDGKPKIPLTITTATVAPPVVGSGVMVTPIPTAIVSGSSTPSPSTTGTTATGSTAPTPSGAATS